MRILFLLQDVPFPRSEGIRLKVYNVLEYMSGDHQCDVVAFADVSANQRGAKLSEALPRVRVIRTFPQNSGYRLFLSRAYSVGMHLLPPSMARYRNLAVARTLRALLHRQAYDVVHYDVINMAQYIRAGHGTASVHSPNDATSSRYVREAKEAPNLLGRIGTLASAKLLARFERRVYPQFTKIHVVSDTEAQHLLSVSRNIDVEVIPPAVDGEFLRFRERPHAPSRQVTPTLLFTGSLLIPSIANGLSEFMEHAYPRIVSALPNLQLKVLGRTENTHLARNLGRTPGVRVTPWVEDYVGEIAGADVVVFPERGGSGIKHRVLQAMSLGKAVVGSPDAFKGIRVSSGVECIICSNPAEFVESIMRLLQDLGMRRELGSRARRLILRSYTMDTLGPRWVRLYQAAAEKFGRRLAESAMS